jgi:hypothetical protein
VLLYAGGWWLSTRTLRSPDIVQPA